ncbi:hypothetical protein BH11ARM2_BH11ARM2_25370 [soil metagenome]
MTTHIERDYLDEIIDERRESDPEFARIMQARELAAELAARRKELGLTQQQVAERMGVSRPRVTEIERRPDGVAFARVLDYARVLDASFQLVRGNQTA